ncbi:flagellar hook-associated family protein [Microvirga brassicacearum]|uniref:Flagellin n=1 Tax=Microvirga brassicacearum TaxID=2580413 RepID=A0A5N3P3K4_9HYPH|nr:flagellar hook-associated family protein [Microvirga brassicacearum]KAB0264318.1 flagellar hook-associated family protein [Microvirga brassicacearum]
MKTTFISTASLWNSPRTNLDKMQNDLIKANKELVTGRDTDVGLRLGYRTGETISLRQERAELDTLIDSNAAVKVRLDSSSSSLQRIRETADHFMNTLISTPLAERNMAVVVYQAEANLDGLIAGLNKSTNGQYIFGGINTKQKPIGEYSATSPAKIAIDNAFFAEFGFPQNDPAAALIEPAAMNTFLDGAFKNLFRGTDWDNNWSSASSRNIQSLISPADKIATSVNANEQAIQDIAMAYAMALDLGVAGLKETTREALISKVVSTLAGASTGVADLEATLGMAKERLESANDRMDIQKSIFDEKLGKLEGVDPGEAKIRIDQLSTQIQLSFSLTAQLRNLSLINHL